MARSRVSSTVTLPPFQRLLDAHARDVHRFLVATVGASDADDCYQDTWLAAMRAYPRLRDASNLRGWILTVAHHKAIDHLRARRRQAAPVAELPETAAPVTAPASARPHSPTAPDVERDDALWGLVGELPGKQRAAIALRFLADAPYSEISSVMGTSEEAARRNVHEALKRLRFEYQP